MDAFYLACQNGQMAVFQGLLHDVDPSAQDNRALRSACAHGHYEMVKILLDLPLAHGVNPSACDNEALRHACCGGHQDVAQLLLNLPLERGVDPSACDNGMLRSACLFGHLEVVKILLALPPGRGVDFSAFNNEALRFACSQKRVCIVELLLEQDLNLTFRDWLAIKKFCVALQLNALLARSAYLHRRDAFLMHQAMWRKFK